MTYRISGALIASLSAVALLLPANQTFARSGVALAAPAHAPAGARAPMASAPRFHNRRNPFVYWPGGGGFFYDGPSGAESYAAVAQPLSNDVRYTYTYDVPWDWAHRYPPNVVPSDKPYVSSCPSETVTVPGRGGQEQTVNIMRCY